MNNLAQIGIYTFKIVLEYATFYVLWQIKNTQQHSDSLLIHLVNSVNKLKTQHAVDLTKFESKLQKQLQKQEEKYNVEINQLKSQYQS